MFITRSFHGQELAGVIGFGLSLVLWLLSSWRLVFHTIWKKRRPANGGSSSSSVGQRRRGSSSTRNTAVTNTPEVSPRVSAEHQPSEQRQRRRQRSMRLRDFMRLFTRRRTFHCLLWMATTCEALAYLDLSGILPLSTNRMFATKLGYILLDVIGRSVLELLAFSTVTAIWLQTSINANPNFNWLFLSSSTTSTSTALLNCLPPLFGVSILLLVLTSAILSFVVFFSHEDDDLPTIQDLPLLKAQTLLEAISWGIHSLVVLECSIMTSRRIATLIPRTQYRQRLAILCKAILPMLGTALVYAIRCGWLIAVYCSTDDSKFGRGTWYWWIGFMWCPTWIAVILLLYSARKRDSLVTTASLLTNVSGDAANIAGLQQPLLLRPPAEAFLAFSYHRNIGGDDDDLDDSMFSPTSAATGRPIMDIHVFPDANEGGDDNAEFSDEEALSTDSLNQHQEDVVSAANVTETASTAPLCNTSDPGTKEQKQEEEE